MIRFLNQEGSGNKLENPLLTVKITMFFFVILSCAFLFLLAFEMVEGETLTVDDDGNAEYTRIQDAIDYANDDDTVIVGEGIYTGNGNRDLDFKGKSITVRSTDPNDPASFPLSISGTVKDSMTEEEFVRLSKK